MWTSRTVVVASVSLTALAAAPGQGQAPEQSAPPPVQYSAIATSTNSAVPYAPAEVRGYHLTDTTQFGERGGGVQFVFKRGTDTTNVVIGPYATPSPQTSEDTMAVLQKEVARVRDAYDHAAQNAENPMYRKFNDRADVLHVGGHAVRYYWYFAEYQPRDGRGKYIYYGVYALPSGIVRIRGEVPWTPPRGAPASGVQLGNGAAPVTMGGAAETDRSNRPIGHFAGSAEDVGPGPYRDQFVAFSTDLIGAVATHPAEVPAVAPAAPPNSPPPAIQLPAVCAASPAATDTVTYRVYATLEAPLRSEPLPPAYLDLVLDAFRHSFVVPNPLSPSVYVPMVAAGNTVMAPAVYGEVAFTLDDQGKVSDVRPTQSSLSPALDQSLYDAPRRADSLQAFPGQIGVDHPGPVRFFVALSPYQPKSGHNMAFFAVRMPAWRPGSGPGISPLDLQPVFSAGAQQPAPGDSVLIQFAVDEHGLPVNTTMRLLGATHVEYAKTIVDAALHSQYVPALAAGCPVKGLLERSWRTGARGVN